MFMVIGIDASRAFVGEKTGTETYSYQLINSLMQLPESRRHRWILYTNSVSLVKLDQFIKLANVKHVTISLPRLWTQVGLAYRTWVDKLDVLWIPAHTLPILRRPGLPTVVTVHGLEYEFLPGFYGEWARWHLTWSTEYAVRAATKIIAVSQFTKRSLVERLGADKKKIEVVYEGVGEQSKSKYMSKKVEVLKKYSLESQRYILFIGTIQPRKNLVRQVEAFSLLTGPVEFSPPIRRPRQTPAGAQWGTPSTRHPSDLKLVIAGKKGWQFKEVLEAPRRFGVEDKVVFTGYVNDAERDILLHNALVYVQPSITEGFGLPVLEAFAAGIPVVSSRGGALAEVVGNAGLVFDPLDVGDIGRKLSQMVTDGHLSRKMAEQGKKRAGEFSWEKAAIETLEVLERTARGR